MITLINFVTLFANEKSSKSAHFIESYIYDVDLESLLEEPVAPASEELNKYSWEEEAKKLLKLLRE